MGTKIKEIDGVAIYMEDERMGKYVPIRFFILWAILWAIISAGASIIWISLDSIFIGNGNSIFTPKPVSYWGILAIILGGLLSGWMYLAGALNTSIPAYNVYVLGSRKKEILIPKISTDVDQIAICKAVQELEVEVKEVINMHRNMERIANKCK
jgi:hypothetical protein